MQATDTDAAQQQQQQQQQQGGSLASTYQPSGLVAAQGVQRPQAQPLPGAMDTNLPALAPVMVPEQAKALVAQHTEWLHQQGAHSLCNSMCNIPLHTN